MSISPKQKTTSDKSPPRWQAERSRDKSYLNSSEPTGFGSWYKRKPGHYSIEEYGAPQGHAYQVSTADFNHKEKFKRTAEDDDSELESDWFDCTYIDPRRYDDQRNMEDNICKKREDRHKK